MLARFPGAEIVDVRVRGAEGDEPLSDGSDAIAVADEDDRRLGQRTSGSGHATHEGDDMALGDMMGMMKQAKQLQEKMQAMQEEVAAMSIDGSAGGGLVTVTMNGKGEMKAIRIDPSLMKPEEAEIVEDLIVAACNDARAKADAALQEKMREMTGGMNLPPGLKLPF